MIAPALNDPRGEVVHSLLVDLAVGPCVALCNVVIINRVIGQIRIGLCVVRRERRSQHAHRNDGNQQHKSYQLTRSCHNLLLVRKAFAWVISSTHANLLQDYNTNVPTFQVKR